MKYTLQSLALASVASARVLHTRQSSCCFGINVSGDGVQGGSLGQNRFGPNQSGATYCVDGGKITDKNGRGCIVTSPEMQFQCDEGASPTGGFSIASSGQIQHDGDSTFYACPVDDNGNYNIYTEPLDNMPKCVKVGLSSADGTCAAPSSAPASSAPASSAPASSAPASSAPAPSSAPASSAPASSAPASSAPASSAPASSAPASSAPPATTAVSVSVSVPAPSVLTSVSTEQCQPSTVVKTVTETQQAPTVYKTQEHTDFQTETKQIPTTIYQTQTQYSTINETKTVPTTIYQTHEETTTVLKTEEQTQTQTATAPPVTEEVTQKTTIEQPTTVEQPTTIQQSVTETKSIQQPPVTETKSVQQPPVTQSVTEQVTTSVAKPTTSQAPSSSAQQPSATPSGSGKCPRDLPGMDSYLKPRLIVPVNGNSPDKAYGTQYNAYVGNGNSTIFSFDIPQSYEGKQCEVIFTFPTQSQLETSFVSESGNGGIDFKQLKNAADEKTTFNNQPAVGKDFGEKGVSTGNAYSITTGDCAVGQTISYELTATGDYQASWFQDWNPCPIGLWVVAN
ncbi:unnamed protein product [Aureobasidium vineae]|uniref:Ubiquitin 3 binding protein But2 C-terminal domain-containing protein n=1 Tax=Aureobasidium vineae TaxID=2773715 RepID=A0A9N8PE58_9PEZI|nr:unnamed protein product [Aureobasidium vineae]